MPYLTDDSFYFDAAPPPQTGLDRMMDAITAGLEPHLNGQPFTAHLSANLSIEQGRLQVTLAALTPLGETALRRFAGEQVP